jgi:REP element-mobilizing transposase RayT
MKYITRTIQNKNNKLLAVNTMPDHIHIFIGLNPKNSISDLVKDIKVSSTDFINGKKWLKGKFHWQEGYGAFSYSHSQIDNVIKYIQNQEKHHRRTSFKEEYIKMLKAFDVKYEDLYLFKWFDELKY